jgi:hypothetical protein
MLGDLGGDMLMSLPPVEFPSISGILIHCLKGLLQLLPFLMMLMQVVGVNPRIFPGPTAGSLIYHIF